MKKTGMKEMMKQREPDIEQWKTTAEACTYYADGNTVIRIREFFPENGKTAVELIERTVCYETGTADRTKTLTAT